MTPHHSNPIGGDVGFSKAGPGFFLCETGFSESGAGAAPRSSRAGLDSQERDKRCTTPQAPGHMLNLLLGTAF